MRINGLLFSSIMALSLLFGQTQVLAAIQEPAGDQYLQGWEAYKAGQYKQARQVWLPLAQQGNPSAQLNLGILYDYGQGVSENPAQALHWYSAAAEQGKAIAQFNLAAMYASGRGTTQDYSQAARLYFQAAEQGITDAQYNLGLMFSKGLGVTNEPILASQWFYRAGLGYLERDRPSLVRNVIGQMNKLEGTEQLTQHLVERLSSLGYQQKDDVWENASVGTGWPIAQGYVVTNDHVIGDRAEIVLIDDTGREISAKIVARNQQQDLALLSVSDPHQLPPPLPIAGQGAQLGASVFTIGYPRIDILGKTPKLTAGLISSENGFADDPSRYQLSLPIQSGNSGGPLLNMNGEVVGIVTSMLGTVDANGNLISSSSTVSYAVKADFLQEMISQVPPRNSQTVQLALANTALENMADRIQRSVLIVRAK